MNNIEKIIHIAEKIEERTEQKMKIIVFTHSFKALGNLVTESDMISKGILSLQNAIICSSFENFDCTTAHHSYEWLNLFEDQIVAFSIIDEYDYENEME